MKSLGLRDCPFIDLGFRGVGFKGLGFRDVGFRVQGSGLRVWEFKSRV